MTDASPTAAGDPPGARARGEPGTPARVIVEVGTLEGVLLATSAIESIAHRHSRSGGVVPIVEVVTPFPHAFERITRSYPFVILTDPGPGGTSASPERAFAIRHVGGTAAVPVNGARLPQPAAPAAPQRQSARPAPPVIPPPPLPAPAPPARGDAPPAPADLRRGRYAATAPDRTTRTARPKITRRQLLVGTAALLVTAGGIAEYRHRADRVAAKTVRAPWPAGERPLLLADFLLRPLVEDAWHRRTLRERTDPGYAARVEAPMNRLRYNALLFGWGEEHGESYADFGGSVSVLSFDIRAGLVDSISLSRDIRAPELERLMDDHGQRPRVLRHAFQLGMRQAGGSMAAGFTILRQVVEDMTGLAIDHQFLMKDIFLRDFILLLIARTGRALDVVVGKPHVFSGFRLAGRDYPPGAQVQAGRQRMDSIEAMRYILAEDQNPRGKQDERSYRKSVLFRAILEHLQQAIQGDLRRIATPFSESILDDLLALLRSQRQEGAVIVEHPGVEQLIVNLFSRGFWIRRFADHLLDGDITPGQLPWAGSTSGLLRRQLVVHDPFFGDGGVLRVHNMRDNRLGTAHPLVQQEVTSGILSTREVDWMLIPPGGNPYAQDLIRDYWEPVRTRVRQTLASG